VPITQHKNIAAALKLNAKEAGKKLVCSLRQIDRSMFCYSGL